MKIICVVALGLPLLAALSAWGGGLEFGGRARGGLVVPPISAGSIALEASIAAGDLSVGGWLDASLGSMCSVSGGGEIRLTRQWLSLRGALSGLVGGGAVTAVAEPPSYWLYDGALGLLVDLGAEAAVAWDRLQAPAKSHVVIYPRVRVVGLLGELLVNPSVQYEIRWTTDTPRMSLAGVVVGTTVSGDRIQWTGTVRWERLFERFSWARATVHWPICGFSLSGSILAPEDGRVVYEASVIYEWGDLSRLPRREGSEGSSCIGDVCF
jgi:hypothetical protein